MMRGCKYGTHRVIEPKGVLPQAAQKVSNDMEIYDNELLIEVQALNIDSASFTQIKKACKEDPEKIKEMIKGIVHDRGKMQNPVTGSGGMLIGTIKAIGRDLRGRDLRMGDKIASLVSLTLTPLHIEEIIDIKMDIDRVEIKGLAVLFESGIYAKLPEDMEETLALAALDVAGAPAQTRKLVQKDQTVMILGASGKSGLLCCYEAKKQVGDSGKVIGLVIDQENKTFLEATGLCHEVIIADATKPTKVLEEVMKVTNHKEVDVAINCVNVSNTEMSTILPVRDEGTVYFFSMATSFTKAALGAEGVGKDVNMIIGNGYSRNHAEITLEDLRESKEIREIYEKLYV